MKHVLCVVSVALSLICSMSIAIAITPGVPPHTGPGSVFHGNSQYDPPAQSQKSKPKKKKKSEVPRSTLMLGMATTWGPLRLARY